MSVAIEKIPRRAERVISLQYPAFGDWFHEGLALRQNRDFRQSVAESTILPTVSSFRRKLP